MRTGLTFGVLLLCLPATGCGLNALGVHVMTHEMCLFETDCADNVEYKRLAASAWNEVRCGSGQVAFSGVYADGFQGGFTDYLSAGGTGRAPPLPPSRYLCSK